MEDLEEEPPEASLRHEPGCHDVSLPLRPPLLLFPVPPAVIISSASMSMPTHEYNITHACTRHTQQQHTKVETSVSSKPDPKPEINIETDEFESNRRVVRCTL
jgi:hypothetical protein